MRILFDKPECSPTNKVRRKNGKMFLEKKRSLGTNLEVAHLKSLFVFLDTGFDGLTTIVVIEPGVQISRRRSIAEMKQDTVAQTVTEMKALKREVERIGEVVEAPSELSSKKTGMVQNRQKLG